MVLIKLVSAYVSVRHVTHHVTDEPTINKRSLLINKQGLLINERVLVYILSFKSITVYNLRFKYTPACEIDFKAILIYNLSLIK